MFTETKICEFQMTTSIDEYIVRLDVSMDVVHAMHILNS